MRTVSMHVNHKSTCSRCSTKQLYPGADIPVVPIINDGGNRLAESCFVSRPVWVQLYAVDVTDYKFRILVLKLINLTVKQEGHLVRLVILDCGGFTTVRDKQAVS